MIINSSLKQTLTPTPNNADASPRPLCLPLKGTFLQSLPSMAVLLVERGLDRHDEGFQAAHDELLVLDALAVVVDGDTASAIGELDFGSVEANAVALGLVFAV